jgi:tRNA nucleotidyltransferase (CCA-adding enzyme)
MVFSFAYDIIKLEVYMFDKAIEVLKLIEKKGFKAYIVGGYVRDIYLSLNASDIDIATSATPKDLVKIFGKNVSIDENYGSTKLNYKNYWFDITTFRRDIKYKDNRKPTEIEYVDTIGEDITRRDFTINTLYMDKDGNIIDIYDAKKDINNKVIKCVGNADEKIKEDALRILRAVRFATVLKFKIDKELEKAIKNNLSNLKDLSFHRKKEELNYIFRSSNYEYGISLIHKYKLDKYLDISISKLKKLKQTSDVLGMWAQISYGEDYPFSRLERETIGKIREMLVYKKIDNYSLYKYGILISLTVGEILGIDKKQVLKSYEELKIHSESDIVLNNLDIANVLRCEPSHKTREILNDIEYKILSNKLNNNKKDIEEYIKKKYGG